MFRWLRQFVHDVGRGGAIVLASGNEHELERVTGQRRRRPSLDGIAAQMRADYYAKLGAQVLPWEKLTYAQQRPWLIRAFRQQARR